MPHTSTPDLSVAAVAAPTRTGRRAVAIGLGAVVVALAAQVAVPLPGTPVPMTLQALAVLVVGGSLGAGAGALALAGYLALGAAGLPVFAAGGAGPAWLLGPTGGYLLAFPVAAAVVGALTGSIVGRPVTVGAWARVLLAGVAGLAIIHLGGVSQLALLGGDLERAALLGTVPFLVGDLLKVVLAAGLLLGPGRKLRTLL